MATARLAQPLIKLTLPPHSRHLIHRLELIRVIRPSICQLHPANRSITTPPDHQLAAAPRTRLQLPFLQTKRSTRSLAGPDSQTVRWVQRPTPSTHLPDQEHLTPQMLPQFPFLRELTQARRPLRSQAPLPTLTSVTSCHRRRRRFFHNRTTVERAPQKAVPLPLIYRAHVTPELIIRGRLPSLLRRLFTRSQGLHLPPYRAPWSLCLTSSNKSFKG